MRHLSSGESGQAMLELLAMLLGLAVLIVGIVVFSAFQAEENTVLLRSKYRTETASRDGGADYSANREIAGWRRRRASLYHAGSSATIPFTSGDEAVYARENSLEGAAGELAAASRSAAETYLYEALYPSRFDLRSSHIEELSGINAVEAARLVSRNGERDAAGGVSSDRMYDSGLLVDVFRRLIGRLPSPDDNASSRVYMPLRDGTEYRN